MGARAPRASFSILCLQYPEEGFRERPARVTMVGRVACLSYGSPLWLNLGAEKTPRLRRMFRSMSWASSAICEWMMCGLFFVALFAPGRSVSGW